MSSSDDVTSADQALAFGLVLAAGACAAIGGCVVWCADMAKPRLLAGSLGFSAGVMIYVSFAEIYMNKAVAAFEGYYQNGDEAYATMTTDEAADADAAYRVRAFRYATLAFFGGFAVIALLDKGVHALMDLAARRGSWLSARSRAKLLEHEDARGARPRRGGGDEEAPAPAAAAAAAGAAAAAAAPPALQHMDIVPCACFSKPAAAAPGAAPAAAGAGGSRPGSPRKRHGSPRRRRPADSADVAAADASDAGDAAPADADGGAAAADDGGSSSGDDGAAAPPAREPPAPVDLVARPADPHAAFALQKMGLLTAAAIFIHNFPEGLATYIASLADARVGAGVAVAIAMHNIPEGVCVAMPIFYATGSRRRALGWAALSGVSEPVGALVGYFALRGTSPDSLAFGVVFALVAGMMVYISVKELIPTALRYDPADGCVTTMVVVGMAVMAASLLLFSIGQG